MKYIINEVKTIEGLDERYVKVTFKDNYNGTRVVLFDCYTGDIYDYMIDYMDHSNLYNKVKRINIYHSEKVIYLFNQDDVKEFLSSYDDEYNFIDLYNYYNKNKKSLIFGIKKQLETCC